MFLDLSKWAIILFFNSLLLLVLVKEDWKFLILLLVFAIGIIIFNWRLWFMTTLKFKTLKRFLPIYHSLHHFLILLFNLTLYNIFVWINYNKSWFLSHLWLLLLWKKQAQSHIKVSETLYDLHNVYLLGHLHTCLFYTFHFSCFSKFASFTFEAARYGI